MKILKRTAIFFAVMALLAAGLFLWDEFNSPRWAARLASEFLHRHNLELSEFSGPEVVDGPHTLRMYRWRSIGMNPPMMLDICPGYLRCLYVEEDPYRFTEIECIDET